LVIPFWDKTKPRWSYWTEDEERLVWEAIQAFMESPRVELLWQNGMYDYQYVTPMKIKVHRSTEDTMLLHHSLFPELQKSLGFMGSLYTNEASWKLMRRWKPDSEKKDE
jgi:DNA polymerase I-like protein with 3'-5' exonuclease and polymerase domains